MLFRLRLLCYFLFSSVLLLSERISPCAFEFLYIGPLNKLAHIFSNSGLRLSYSIYSLFLSLFPVEFQGLVLSSFTSTVNA